MFRTALILSLLIPTATAFAQAPGGDQPPPGPPPAPMQPPPPPPPGYGPPPPGYAPPPPAGYAPPPAYVVAVAPGWQRHGFTFEANLGVGYIHVSSNGDTANSDIALAGLDLGIGGFVTPNLALTLRFAGVTYTDSSSQDKVIDGFVGPSVQFWANENLWLRGGLGIAVLGIVQSGDTTIQNGNGESAFGLDLGVGYSFSTTTKNAFNVSAELTPGFFSEGTATSVSFLAGYQYL